MAMWRAESPPPTPRLHTARAQLVRRNARPEGGVKRWPANPNDGFFLKGRVSTTVHPPAEPDRAAPPPPPAVPSPARALEHPTVQDQLQERAAAAPPKLFDLTGPWDHRDLDDVLALSHRHHRPLPASPRRRPPPPGQQPSSPLQARPASPARAAGPRLPPSPRTPAWDAHHGSQDVILMSPGPFAQCTAPATWPRPGPATAWVPPSSPPPHDPHYNVFAAVGATAAHRDPDPERELARVMRLLGDHSQGMSF